MSVPWITLPSRSIPTSFAARITAVLQVVSRQETLTTAANTDGLTGLYNRRHIMQCF